MPSVRRRFAYSPLPDIKSRVVLAPLVPVTFFHGKRDFSTFALVDSGASSAVVSTIIAEALQIKWERAPVRSGASVGGTFRSHHVEGVVAVIFDYQFSLSVNVVEGIGPYKCILGQADLFHHATITFEAYKNEFEILFRQEN